jgi:hypothetical protein
MTEQHSKKLARQPFRFWGCMRNDRDRDTRYQKFLGLALRTALFHGP